VSGYIARLRAQDEANRRAVVANRWAVLQVAALRVQRRITAPGRALDRWFEQQLAVADAMLAMLPKDPPRVVLQRQRELLAEVDAPAEARAAARRRVA